LKLHELHEVDQSALMHAAREFITDKRTPLADPPTLQQLYAMRRRDGIVIGPGMEVLRFDMFGKLRVCAHGIPCDYECSGMFEQKKCNWVDTPDCNVADGACMLTKKPCCDSCKAGQEAT
jgi:hypothetical protein